MDGTTNEHPDVDIKGYPTIVMFKAKKGAKPIPVSGDRSLAVRGAHGSLRFVGECVLGFASRHVWRGEGEFSVVGFERHPNPIATQGLTAFIQKHAAVKFTPPGDDEDAGKGGGEKGKAEAEAEEEDEEDEEDEFDPDLEVTAAAEEPGDEGAEHHDEL
jgi:hypothetical protein